MALSLPSAVPTTGCTGGVVTATWTSSIPVKTLDTNRIAAGSFWYQGGASWEFTLNDPSLVFNSFGIPGAGGGFKASQDPRIMAQKALAMNNDKKTLTLSVPYPTLGGQFDINIAHGPSITQSLPIAVATPAEKKVDLLIKARMPCLDPKEASHRTANPGDPTLASSCINGKITPGPEAWRKYDVPKYMASILSAAGPVVREGIPPSVDGAEVIHRDVNPPGAKCTWESKCDSVSCKDVQDNTIGSQESIQRFLAYQAVVNFNNFLWSCKEKLMDTATISALTSPNIVNTFFSNPTPDATGLQIAGGILPLLGLGSALTAPFLVPSAGLGAAAGIAGLAMGQATQHSVSAIEDKRFSELGSLSAYIQGYLQESVQAINDTYEGAIGKRTSIFQWTGPPVDKALDKNDHGIFGNGAFSDNNNVQDLTKDLLPNMIKIFTYKAINYAWTDSGVFIMFVPYGRDIMGPDGNIIHNFNADYCRNSLDNRDLVGKAINCDVPGGMAALFNAADGSQSGTLKQPQGYDTKFSVLPNRNFDVMGAISGSIASWRKGDFKYDAGDPYKDALKQGGRLSEDQLKEIGKIAFDETTPGIFNLPVCQVLDLRFFPYAKLENRWKSCTACGNALGGKPGSSASFWDAANEIVKKTLRKGNEDYSSQYGTITKCAKGGPWKGS